jgi:O-antigen ligase
MNTLLVAATSAFLFVAPFPGSAGLRASLLVLAGIALLARPAALREALAIAPRGVAIAFAAWCALAIASLAWSVQPRYTLGELKSEILYGAIALASYYVAALADPARWRVWARALLAGAALLAAWFVIQDWLPFTLAKQTLVEQRGPWSTHLVLLAPVLLVLWWAPPWGEARAAWAQAAALAAFLAAAWMTGNRVMWLALAVQLVVVIALSRRTPLAVAPRAATSRRLAIAAVAAVVLAFGASLVEHNERFFGADAPLATSFERDLRPRIWSVAMGQVMQAPWLGHGYGREIVAPAFSPLTPPHYPELRHAHNVFLDAAIGLGVAGVLVLIALFVALAREYRACLARAETAPLGVMGLALVAGFVVKCLTDDFMYRHNALVFWALNGALLGLARTLPRPLRPGEPAPR